MLRSLVQISRKLRTFTGVRALRTLLTGDFQTFVIDFLPIFEEVVWRQCLQKNGRKLLCEELSFPGPPMLAQGDNQGSRVSHAGPG